MARTTEVIAFLWYGVELTAKVEYYPGDPGVLSGPPERCYPPEPPEVNILELKYRGQDMFPLLESDWIQESITEAILDYYANLEQDEDYGPEDLDEPNDIPDNEADAQTLASAGMGTDEDYRIDIYEDPF